MKTIVLTGPESTGKSTLCKQLSEYFNVPFLPEFARTYLENLKRPYIFEDLEYIAAQQIYLEKLFLAENQKMLFIDTDLIITKIWFCEVYGCCPIWLHKAIIENEHSLYLLCFPDIEWIPDSVRENGGKNRIRLLEMYQKEYEFYNFSYKILKGKNEKRFENALNFVKNLL